MSKRRSRKPREPDINTTVKGMFDRLIARAEGKPEPPKEPAKNPAAVALSKLGAKKGGQARAAALTSKRRKEIAKKAAMSRWSKKRKS